MSDRPITRPDEISRISQDTTEFRITMLRFADRADAWMSQHEKEDNERFDRMEKRLMPITSSVNDYNENVQQFAGAKKLVVGIVAIGAIVWAVFEAGVYLAKLIKGQP